MLEMARRLGVRLIAVALLMGCGAVAGSTTDAAAPDADPRPGATFVTAGGGSTASASFRLEVWMGAPQPMGSAAGSDHGVTLGPTTP